MRNITKKKIAVCLIILLLLSAIIYLIFAGANIIGEICSTEVNAIINNLINESNDIVMRLDVFYSDYFTLMYDKNDNLSAIMANTGLINQITLIWNTEIQNRLNSIRMLNIKLPAGAITGSALLSQYGRELEINARVVSNCAITYKSELIHSGINQTLHRLILYTEVIADVTVPLTAQNVKVTQEIILAETLLPGAVPDSYLIGESSSDYLDLLP